jgi:hypothetical protein
MARIAIATLQPVWDCRWSQPGHRITGVSDAAQPETRWVCVREGHRRNIDEQECETCGHWELAGAGALSVSPAGTLTAQVSAPGLEHQHRALDLWSRVVTLLTAALLAASGFVLLTGPLMIPFVVVLWLGAAAFGAFTFFGRFPGAQRSSDW